MRSYLRRIATKARRALNVLAIAACSCHADPSPLSNDGSPNASVPVALERAGAPVVHVKVLRLAYPAEGTRYIEVLNLVLGHETAVRQPHREA